MNKIEQSQISESDECFIYVKQKVFAAEYNVYLTDSVESPEYYRELLFFLDKVTSKDRINIDLANFGGSCHACVAICNKLLSCKADIAIKVVTPCYSAASTIALCGNSLDLEPHTFLMFHNYSTKMSGKGDELTMAVKHTNRWINGYFNDLHQPFLSKRECAKLINDKDIYVSWDDEDLDKRIKRHFK